MKKTLLIALIVLVQFLVVPSVSADGGDNDRVVFGDSVVIGKDDTVKDLVVFGGSVRILGTVEGDLVVLGGSATVSGAILGDMVVFGGSVVLESTASVGGDLVTIGGSLRKEPGATVGGSLVKGVGLSDMALHSVPFGSFRWDNNPFWGFVAGLIKGVFATIALLALAVLAVVFFSQQLEVTEDVLENALWQSAGLGVLTLLAATLLTPILLISIIGIPVAFLLWMILFLVALYALVASANLIGDKVMRSARVGLSGPLVNVLVGTLLIMVVVVPFNAISGGCLGTILLLLLVIPGVGATALSRFGTMRWRPSGLRV